MAGVDEMMQQMRRMQEDMNRVMMRPMLGFGGRHDPFNTMALLDRDPFISAPSIPTSSALSLSSTAMPLDVYKPTMDVIDMGDVFAVHVDLPGMQKQDVKVDVNDGMLNIAAEHKEDKKRTEGNWVVQERRFGKFRRTLKLPENVKGEEIKATLNDGVLELNLPKMHREKGVKNIAIE